jgi:hypothetical protein
MTLTTHTFTRAGYDMTIDAGALAPDIVTELVYHGLTQKIGDAAAGKKGGEAKAAMQKVIDALLAGDWGVRRTGGGKAGATPLEKAAKAIAELDFMAVSADKRNAAVAKVMADKGMEKAAARAAIIAAMAQDERRIARAEASLAEQGGIDLGGLDL